MDCTIIGPGRGNNGVYVLEDLCECGVANNYLETNFGLWSRRLGLTGQLDDLVETGHVRKG